MERRHSSETCHNWTYIFLHILSSSCFSVETKYWTACCNSILLVFQRTITVPSSCCCRIQQWRRGGSTNLQHSDEEQRQSTSSHDETAPRVGEWNRKPHVRAHSLSPCCCFLQQVSLLGGRTGLAWVTGRIQISDRIEANVSTCRQSLYL